MLPCFICGCDAGTGWVQGFPPAPDSQKLALCKVHDTEENRAKVLAVWQELIAKNIALQTQGQVSSKVGLLKLLSLYFTGGGSIAVECTDVSRVEPNSLKIVTPSGELIFFPLQQVRSYALSPVTATLNELSK